MRNVAYHVPLGLVARAEPLEEEGITYFRLPTGLKVKRVHVWGVVVHKFEGDEYVRFVLDDFSGVVPVVLFSDLAEQARKMDVGDVVDVVGRLRVRNEEIGIVGESVRRISPLWELIRRVENLHVLLGIEQSEEETVPPPAKEGEKVEEEEELEVETIDLEG